MEIIGTYGVQSRFLLTQDSGTELREQLACLATSWIIEKFIGIGGSFSIMVAFLIFFKGISCAISGRLGKSAGEISTVFFR